MIRETISELVIRYKFLVDLGGHNKNRSPIFLAPMLRIM